MPYYLVRIEDHLILPSQFQNYICAVENCDFNEQIYIADDRKTLEEMLEAVESEIKE